MENLPDDVRREAAAWLARMRGPDADQSRAEFAAWRSASPDHDAAYRQLQQRWEQTRFTGNLDIVRERNLSRAQVWHRRPAVRVAAAACAALFALGGVGWLVHGQGPTLSSSLAYETGIGQTRSIALDDGSQVTLDANSAVHVAFERATRNAELVRGRARFSVAGKDARPFVVRADAMTVTALDTDFDVDLAPSAPRVALLRGDADVRGARATGKPAALWRLRAGQQILVAEGATPQAAPANAFQWTGGMLTFDGDRLDGAIAAFNRHGRVKIVLDDPALGSLRITGAFHANDPRGFATAIASMFGLQVGKRADGTITLARVKKVVG